MRPAGLAKMRPMGLAATLALIWIPVFLVGSGTPLWAFGVFLSIGAAASLGFKRRFELTPTLQAALHVVVLGIGLGLALLWGRSVSPSPKAGHYVTVGLLCLAVPRLYLVLGRLGHGVTLAFALIAIMGLSRSMSREAFGVLVSVFLILSLLEVVASRAHGLRAAFGEVRLRWKTALALTLALGIMAALGSSLPAAEGAVTEYLGPYMGEGQTATSGYSEGSTRIGSYQQILESDEVMLRLHPSPGVALDSLKAVPERLRGQAYQTYRAGTWMAQTQSDDITRLEETGRLEFAVPSPGSGDTLEVELAGELGRAVFLPEHSAALEALPTGTAMDVLGTVRAPTPLDPPFYRVRTGGLSETPPQSEAGDDDRRLPPMLLKRLAKLSGSMVSEGSSPARRSEGSSPARTIEAIVSSLHRDNRYSLTQDEPPEDDVVWFFLSQSHAGHCELFASALVLLARSQGIAARYVTGFLVRERNELGGWLVVRARDAHAWAEVYIDGHWKVVEATPPGPLLASRGPEPGELEHRLDLLGHHAWKIVRRLQGLGTLELGALLLSIALLSAVLIWLRWRRVGRRPPIEVEFEALRRLELHLAGMDLQRPPERTLINHASVVRAAGDEASAGLLEAISALIYGAKGDAVELERAVDERVRPQGRPRAP